MPPERIFQGAIADALTHVGQLAMLRRLAGAKIKAENYSRAEIVAGRVGADQSAPRRVRLDGGSVPCPRIRYTGANSDTGPTACVA